MSITGSNYTGKLYPTGIEASSECRHLSKSKVVAHLYTLTSSDDPTNLFTQLEVDKMPHGFVKMFHVKHFIKEEPRFYIQLPYLSDSSQKYVNVSRGNDRVFLDDNYETRGFQTKFTMDEIREYYPKFEIFAIPVE